MAKGVRSGSKITVIGAGNVGATIAYTMAVKHCCDELVIVDIIQDKAEGEARDIRHGLPFLNQMQVYSGTFEDVKGSDIIVFAAGAGRKPGETRMDLAAKNCKIAKSAVTELMKYYDGGVILVVANPVDVITYHIQRWSGLPKNLVVGSGTVLDGMRFRTLLSDKLKIDVKNIHSYILGEHGETQFPAWDYSKVAGSSIKEYCKLNNIVFSDADKEEVAEATRKAGSEIIKRKGATFYGIGVATTELCESLLHDENTIRTVGCFPEGEYGLSDLVINIPCIVGSNGIEKILEVHLSDKELENLKKSAENIKKVIAATKDI